MEHQAPRYVEVYETLIRGFPTSHPAVTAGADQCVASQAPINRSTGARHREDGPVPRSPRSRRRGCVLVHRRAGRCPFAHRRLSIIDLQHGQQPLAKQPLRALLQRRAVQLSGRSEPNWSPAAPRFSTTSDTEVVLEAWRRWGPQCLRRFRGMFAFAVLDQTTGSLFLARDQFGIKPLHFIRRKDGVVFASELKALVSAFGSELRHASPGARGVHALLLGARPDVLGARASRSSSRARGPSSVRTARTASSGIGTSSKRRLQPKRPTTTSGRS